MTLSSPPRRHGASRAARWLAVAGALLVLLGLSPLVPGLLSGTELVRVRHALALASEPARDWRPPAVPQDFVRDAPPHDPYFVEVANRLQLGAKADDWERALAISRHLLSSAPHLNGGAVRHDLRTTYRAIVAEGTGYCGDFVRVFTAIANAAGMLVRPWGFSFDGFGGHGHIWIEVWNQQRGRWELVDVFGNAYFVAGGGRPLSALEFHAALQSGRAGVRMLPLDPGGRPGYVEEAKAWAYYERGRNQWYAPWGNNVLAVDAAWPTRLFAGLSRSLEQGANVLIGTAPRVRLLVEPANEGERASLRALRQRLHLGAFAAVLGGCLLIGTLAFRRRAPTPARAAAAADEGGGAAVWPRVAIVGPLPPPAGGMANQCEQLLRLLGNERVQVEVVRTNAPYWPHWVGCVPHLRALFRLVPYLVGLWRALGRAQVVHLFANSGWSWYLVAKPALVLAGLRGRPLIVNYRGGQADEFLSAAPAWVQRDLRSAALCVTPSGFLRDVFGKYRIDAEIIPNVIDLERFRPQAAREFGTAPRLLVARHLEPIYDIATSLRAFAQLRGAYPGATLSVAGAGPERAMLESLAAELGLADAVRFVGRVDNRDMPALFAQADLMLNSSRVDNMPISLLEAMASGVPVVTTAAGGIPHMVRHEFSALIVPVGDARSLADAALRVLAEPELRARLRSNGLDDVRRYAWPAVRAQWHGAYCRALRSAPNATAREAGS